MMNDEMQAQAQAPAEEKHIPASTWIWLAVGCAILSTVVVPPVAGGFGIYFGYKTKQAGSEGAGIALMVVSAACMGLGMFLGMLSGLFS